MFQASTRHPDFSEVYNNVRNRIVSHVGTVQVQLHKEALLHLADVLVIIMKQNKTDTKKSTSIKKKGPVEIIEVAADVSKSNKKKSDSLATEKQLIAKQLAVHRRLYLLLWCF